MATKIDGRTQRAERSRAAIAEAMLNLLREGKMQPTAAEVAKRAGVSPRLVFHHFSDMEAVNREAIRLQTERVMGLLPTVSPSKPFPERLMRFVEDRTRLLEDITPVRRAGLIVAFNSKKFADVLQFARKVKREQTSSVFRRELDAFSGEELKERESALQVTASWDAWEVLRTYQGLSLDDARRVLRRTLCLILGVPLP